MTLRRVALGLMAACLFAGCERTAERLLDSMLPMTGAQAAAPGASGEKRLILRMPDRKVSVLLFEAGESRGVRRWRALDNAQVYTRDGMIIATRGMGDDLMDTDDAGVAALVKGYSAGQHPRVQRRLDGAEQITLAAWVCDVTPAGREQVQVSETEFEDLRRIEEACYGPSGNVTNVYWSRSSGQILQSRQFVSPGVGVMEVFFLDG